MPKSSAAKAAKKKHAAGKSDFAKVRHKVGRKVPQAANATNTTVKAKRVVLAGQTLGADRADRVLTSRGLAVEEVLAQLTHYAPRVRRDALGGLRELLGEHPWLLPLHAARIYGALAARIADGDREVRGALRALLCDDLLAASATSATAAASLPFVPLLTLHTAGALTHLDEGVRSDALRVLDALLTAAPGDVVGGAPAALLRHFVDLLGGGAGSVRWSASHLDDAVASLVTLLAALLQRLRPDGLDRCEPAAGAGVHVWAPEAAPATPLNAHRNWGCCADGETGERFAGAEPPQDAAFTCAALLPRLFAIWAQLAPGLGEPGGADVASLACLTRVLRAVALCTSVAAAVHAAAAVSAERSACAAAARTMDGTRRELLASLRRWFPVGAAAAPNTPHGRACTADLNLAAAQLLLVSDPGTALPPGAADAVSSHADELHAAACEHVAAMLREVAVPRGSGVSLHAAEANVHALLRLALAALLHCKTAPPERETLLAAVTALWEAASPRSQHKAATLALLHSAMRTVPPVAPPAYVCRWLKSLPRLLFDLRDTQPDSTHGALCMLLDAARSSVFGSATADALTSLEPELATFFALCFAGRAPRAGPFLRMPARVQVVALSLLGSLPCVSAPTLRAVALCALSPSASRGIPERSAEAVACCSGAELPLLLGWMGTLLLGQDAAGAQGVSLPPPQPVDAQPPAATARAVPALSWAQRREVVRAACIGLSALAPRLNGASPWDVAAALWPALQQSGVLAAAHVPRQVSYALLEYAADVSRAAASGGVDATDGMAPPKLETALPSLLVAYVVASAAEGALSVPPDIAPHAADADDPGVTPAALLLQSCPWLMRPVAEVLASHASSEQQAVPLCLTALAALAHRKETNEAFLHASSEVQACFQTLTADAAALRMPHASVARHLDVTLRRLLVSHVE